VLAFQQQLDALEAELIAIAQLVADLIGPITTAFLEADTHGAGRVATVDVEVDRRCLMLEERCFELLARQSPVAGDLRRVVAVLRSIADVQRSGDLLRHVAESLAWVHPPSMNENLATMIGQLGEVAGKVFGGSIVAWREHDALAAVELQRLDDDVDLLQKSLLTELYLGVRRSRKRSAWRSSAATTNASPTTAWSWPARSPTCLLVTVLRLGDRDGRRRAAAAHLVDHAGGEEQEDHAGQQLEGVRGPSRRPHREGSLRPARGPGRVPAQAERSRRLPGRQARARPPRASRRPRAPAGRRRRRARRQ
jgi:phosphate transport system protein